MSTVRDQICALIEQRLKEIDGVALVELMPSGDPDDFPALSIYDSGQRPIEYGASATRYEMDITIEGYAEGEGGPAVHASLNSLYGGVVSALLPEPPLGGLAEEIAEGGMRVSVATLASARRLGFGLDFTIQFSTARENPALPA